MDVRHAALDEPLVDDEYAEAWPYGPVFASLYHEFKHRGRRPIMDFATELNLDDLTETTPRIPKSDKRTTQLLDQIREVCGRRSGLELSRITHRPGSPWETTRKRTGGRKNANIRDEEIKNYYKKLGRENRQRQQA